VSETRADSVGSKIARAKFESHRSLADTLKRGLLRHAILGESPPTVGRYEVRRKLGEGGMSTVFEAWDPNLSRTIALKVLHGDHSDRGVDIQHEARALARLTDPSIVTVHDLGVEQDQLYVCMALVDGGDAARWLERHGPVGWKRIVGWFADAARGLHAAHSANIVHRDFKLENLLIGSDGHARVTDFGLARLDGRDGILAGDESGIAPELGDAIPDVPRFEHAPPITGSWPGVVGTPGYIAPEVRGGQTADARSDQWALFVALDRALTRADDTLPNEVLALIERGTDADPLARFEDLAEVEAELRRLLGESDTGARRARELLARRVRTVWLEGVRDRAVATVGRVLPLGTSVVTELSPEREALSIAATDALGMAQALRQLAAGVLLIGAPGSGKTVRLTEVAAALLERASVDEEAPLPVILNLSAFAGHRGSFREWLQNELVSKYALSRAQVIAWIDAGRISLLLDGLDELAPSHRDRFVAAFHEFRAEQPLAFLITCREDEARALAPMLRCDLALRTEALDPGVIAEALAALDASESAALQALLGHDSEVAEQLRNPLLLTLFLLLREELGAAVFEPEGLRERLYEAALAHALAVPPAVPEAERGPAVAGLEWLAQTMGRVGVTELWLEELQMSWLPTRGLRVLGTVLALLVALLGAIAVNLPAAWIGGQPTALGLVWATASAGSAFAILRGLRIVPMEAMRWSWRRFWTWVPANVGMGTLAGFANSRISGEPQADMLLGAITGLLGMSMIGLVPAGRERRVRPNEGMRESIRNACIVAPLVALLLFVGVGYVAVPLVTPMTGPESMYQTFADPRLTWGLTMGVAGGYATWLATGMWAPLAQGVLRLLLAWKTPLPLKLEAWLDDWARRDLLRRVGGGWMFRHQTFRTWLERRRT
jgi:hypothetical protein